jgi:hypothetical protein
VGLLQEADDALASSVNLLVPSEPSDKRHPAMRLATAQDALAEGLRSPDRLAPLAVEHDLRDAMSDLRARAVAADPVDHLTRAAVNLDERRGHWLLGELQAATGRNAEARASLNEALLFGFSQLLRFDANLHRRLGDLCAADLDTDGQRRHAEAARKLLAQEERTDANLRKHGYLGDL